MPDVVGVHICIDLSGTTSGWSLPELKENISENDFKWRDYIIISHNDTQRFAIIKVHQISNHNSHIAK